LCSLASALQIQADAPVNINRLSRRIQQNDVEFMWCEYESYRSNKANSRAISHIYAYQIMGANSIPEPMRMFIDFQKLRLRDNTIKVTLREGTLGSRSCSRATDFTDMKDFGMTSPEG
jgi:hypothetical protein